MNVPAQVRYLLSSMGRLEDVTQVLINPSDEAYFNVVSSMSKKEDVRVSCVIITVIYNSGCDSDNVT